MEISTRIGNKRFCPIWILLKRTNGKTAISARITTCESGRVEEWDGAGGMLWIAALLEGAQLFGNSDYKEAAVAGGAYYESFIINEYIYGAPEDASDAYVGGCLQCSGLLCSFV